MSVLKSCPVPLFLYTCFVLVHRNLKFGSHCTRFFCPLVGASLHTLTSSNTVSVSSNFYPKLSRIVKTSNKRKKSRKSLIIGEIKTMHWKTALRNKKSPFLLEHRRALSRLNLRNVISPYFITVSMGIQWDY